MLRYDDYVARYGEFVVQSIIEQIERNEGIAYQPDQTLQQRWVVLMKDVTMAELAA